MIDFLTPQQVTLAQWLAQEYTEGRLRDAFTLEWRIRDNVPDWGTIKGHPDQKPVSYAQLSALESAGLVKTINVDRVGEKKSGTKDTPSGPVFQYGHGAYERSRTYTILGGLLGFAPGRFGEEGEQVHAELDRLALISQDLISQLRNIQSNQFDLSRLVKYCEEANDNYIRGNFSSVLFGCRAILDHCPPIFGEENFDGVAAHTKGRSSKATLVRLNESLRDITDHHLHKQIGKKEVLPTAEEVGFSNDLNHLIARIIEKLSDDT